MKGNGGVALCSSGRVSCENEIVVLDVADMTRKASLVLCGIDRFAVDEPPEAPAMAVRIFPGVLDHHCTVVAAPGTVAGGNSADCCRL